MRTMFSAVWYEREKCEARAIKAGWDPKSGEGFLDIYMPDEDPKGADAKEFPALEPAVAFLQQLIVDGRDFWGQARIDKFEIGGERCKYCVCRGQKCVHTYQVDDEGLCGDSAETQCCED